MYLHQTIGYHTTTLTNGYAAGILNKLSPAQPRDFA